MSQLIHRVYSLSIGTPTRPAEAVYGNISVPGRPLTPLRVTFELKKTAQAASNKGKISIWNMAAATRANATPGMMVTLTAGYREIFQTLFYGVIAKATSERKGADIETAIELGDGESAISQVPFNVSYPKGTKLSRILSDLAKAMSEVTPANPAGVHPGVVTGIPVVKYPYGYAAKGVASNVMRTLCNAHGLQWSIQNGALNITPVRGSTSKTELAEMVSVDTGMLGIPSVNGETVTFSNLINPNIAPTRLVKLYTQTVKGIYIVKTVDLAGDTHGDKWEMKCEAVAPGAKVQASKAAQGFDYEGAEELD